MLTSKVQYKNFEPGEFVEVQERNYLDTITLIENFPWKSQRDNINIGLTNPSVTIEGKNNDFLKCALFFNQKYVLHYFDVHQVLFTKSFTNLKDSYNDIGKFFDPTVFDITDFKKETTWLQHNVKHFVTQDFRYLVTPQSARRYLLSTSGIHFIISMMLVILMTKLNSHNIIGLFFILFGMFLVGGGLHLIFFFSYYNYVKNKILIMSRGNDIFYYGNIANALQFDKKNILHYTTIRSHGTRNQWNGFAIIEIEFKDGTILKIPNLLIDYLALEEKLFEYPRIDVNRFPYLRTP